MKMEMLKSRAIFCQVVERPKRKAIIKRAVTAEDYFKYCEEVGCDVWGVLVSVKEALYEPVGMWLPDSMIKEGTSKYVQGVEVPESYCANIPEGFELLDLPAAKYMIFQSEPYNDDDFMTEVCETMVAIEKYDPTIYGYEYDEEIGPRFQLEPQGHRGYIEAKPIKAR